MRNTLLAATALLLVACGSSSSSSFSSSSSPKAGAAAAASSVSSGSSTAPVGSEVLGRVLNAPAETLVHLVQPNAGARTLLDQAETILASTETNEQGRFRFSLSPNAAPLEVLVSAPGRALLRADLGTGDLTLSPEAVCTVTLDASEEDAMGLVLADDGRLLAVPPAELVANASGVLNATRLPAGRYQLVVGSADGQRFASEAFVVAEGARVALNLTLAPNRDDQLLFLRAIGHPEANAFLAEVAR
jgi:hypothetical protein